MCYANRLVLEGHLGGGNKDSNVYYNMNERRCFTLDRLLRDEVNGNVCFKVRGLTSTAKRCQFTQIGHAGTCINATEARQGKLVEEAARWCWLRSLLSCPQNSRSHLDRSEVTQSRDKSEQPG